MRKVAQAVPANHGVEELAHVRGPNFADKEALAGKRLTAMAILVVLASMPVTANRRSAKKRVFGLPVLQPGSIMKAPGASVPARRSR